MKKTILAILAAFCGFCASVRADDEGEGGEGDGGDKPYLQWAMPQNGWENISANIRLQFAGWDKPLDVPIGMDYTLDEIGGAIDGMIKKTQMSESAKNAFMLSRQALANAAFASIQAQRNTVRIDNLCASVEALFSNTYGQYETAGGKVISKIHSSSAVESIREQLLKSKNNIAAGGSALGGTADKPIKIVIDQKPYSEKQFEQWEEGENNSLVSLKGYQYLDEAAGDEQLGNADIFTWAVGSGNYYIPYTTGKTRSIQWMKFRGADSSCLSGGLDTGSADDKQLHIRYWSNPNQSGCSESIQNLLTNKTDGIATDRQKHALLARYDTGGGKADVHWVKFDASALEAGGSPAVDDHTIEQSIDPGAAENSQKKLRLYGFKGANAHMIPMKEAAGDNDYKLAWTSEITADDSSLVTNPVDRTMSLKGWGNLPADGKTLADELTKPPPAQGGSPSVGMNAGGEEERLSVMLKQELNGNTNLVFYSLGSLYGLTWVTNEVTIVTNQMNWVTNEVTVVTNQMNIVTNEIVTITNNINWVTNEMVVVTNTMNIVTNEMVVITNNINLITNELVVVTNNINLITNELVVVTNTMNWVTNEVVWTTNQVNLITNEMVYVTNTLNLVTNEMVVITNNINLITNEMTYVTNTLTFVTNEMVYVTNTLNLVTNEMVYITNTLSYVTNEIIYVTNTLNIISNQLNWVTNEVAILTNEYVVITNVTEKFNTIENWVVITNYLVNYLGGGDSGGGGGGGGGGEAPPDIPPEHNPYSPQYKKDPLDEVTLPVKNAHVVIAITNEPLTMLESQNIFDFDVIDTNGLQLAQLRGFRAADASKFPMLPVKKKKADVTPPAGEAAYDPETTGDYALDWTEYPEELVKIAGGNSTIQRISSWLRSHTSQTNILELVATNYEALAAMKTNLWSHVRVNTLLDNQSTWTNGAMQIEVKGYENAPYGTHPVKVMGATANSTAWRHDATTDSENVYDISYDLAKYNRSLERLDNYGMDGYSNISNVWQVYGFADAEAGQVPVKREDVGGHHSLHWEYAGSAIKLVGTDASTVSVGRAAETNTVTFASAGDSNVKVHVASDGVGGAVITFGVYYVQDSGSGGGGGSL